MQIEICFVVVVVATRVVVGQRTEASPVGVRLCHDPYNVLVSQSGFGIYLKFENFDDENFGQK